VHHFDGQIPNVAEHAQHVLQDVSSSTLESLPFLFPTSVASQRKF
jgi:hypothetical protein